MQTRTRFLAPLLMALVILGCLTGGWFWYDNNVDRSGWVEKNGTRYYQDFHADPASGWLDLPEGRYYLNGDGTPRTDWQTIDGITYYFDADGSMHTGWLELDGRLHYFGGNGTMVEGWLWLEEGRYYLEDGALLTGWQTIDGSTYHFSPEGIADLGFAEIDGKQYYFDNGVLTTGEAEIDGSTYLFDGDGVMYTGWEETDLGRRYFLPDGSMALGWQEVEGHPRFFGNGGILAVGWRDDGEYRRYFDADGIYVTGKQVIDGQTHYFSPKGIEVVLVNGLNPVPSWYKLDAVNVVDNHDVDRRCYDALTRMLSDLEAAGISYTFNSAYRTVNEQTAILEYRTREHMKQYGLSFEEARDKAYETVAVPRTSEHHLGLAVDLLGTEAVAWLTEHCWDYGFILRYTEAKEGITGIVDEPWHFRYVGTEVSLDMKDSGLCLEEYLGAEAVTFEKVKALYGDELYKEVIYKEPEPQPTEETTGDVVEEEAVG